MATSTTLTALNPREAIADALHRCVLGMDNKDRELFESACVKDDSMTITAGPIQLEGWAAINDFFGILSGVTTTHITSNIRIEVEDSAANTASMTAHAIAYHVRPEDALKPEDTSYTASNLYFIDLIKDSNDGLWKIKKWVFKVLWTTGHRSVLYG